MAYTPALPSLGFSVFRYTPQWRTVVSEGLSGKDKTASLWARGKFSVDIRSENITTSEKGTIEAFFNARKGRGEPFYADISDLYVSSGNNNVETVGIGAGATTIFWLGHTFVKTGTDKIYVNDVLQESGVDYTIDLDAGKITFGSAPTGTITAEYDFYLYCRFDQDMFDDYIDKIAYDVWSVGFKLVSVIT